MAIQHKLVGEVMQSVVCQLVPGQSVYSEAGKFLWKTTNVSMETRLTAAGNGSGGRAPEAGGGGLLKKALSTATEVGKRALAGESMALQWWRTTGDSGLVAFAGSLPGQMRVLELDGATGWYAERDAFVCAESTVGFDVAFTGLKVGRRGGEGFFLEHFTGAGTAVIAGAGTLSELELSRYGGKLQVDTGCIVAFEDSVRYSVERVGGMTAQTAMTAVFGGEGLHLATLEGQGRVIIQSLTLEGMADLLDRRHGRGNAVAGGLFGNERD